MERNEMKLPGDHPQPESFNVHLIKQRELESSDETVIFQERYISSGNEAGYQF